MRFYDRLRAWLSLRAPGPPDEDALKSAAYLTWSEWGPARRTPRPERLAAEYPDVPAQLRNQWIEEFAAVERAVWRVAEQGAGKAFSRRAFAEYLWTIFPWLSGEAIDRAWFLANYYAWHEGYPR